MSSVLFFGTHGTNDPTKATMPFLLAKAAYEAGHETGIALMGEAAYLIDDHIAASIQGFGIPPLKELRDFLIEKEVRISVCGMCGRSRGITEDDFEGKNSGFGTPSDAVEAIMQFDKVVTF